MLTEILLLNAFLSLVFFLILNNNSWGKSFSSNIFKFILKVVLVLFLTAVLSFFSCVSDNFALTLLYSTIYTNYRTSVVPLENCKIVSFDCSRMQQIISLVFASSAFILPVKIICLITLESASKAFSLLKTAPINQ